jgi:hypothetical protein
MVQPTAHTSPLRPYLLHARTSGAMKYGVPLIVDVSCVLSNWDNVVLAPKSAHAISQMIRRIEVNITMAKGLPASLTVPLSSTKIFPPFMSLCMIPLLWRYCNPSSICLVYVRTVPRGNGPKFFSMWASEPPGTHC